MLYATSAEEAAATRKAVRVNGRDYMLSGYVGAAPVRGYYIEGSARHDNCLPQGVRVEQPPGAVPPPHFHEVNQFQVFVGGSGRLGKQAVRPIAVQYANGHTPYGPVVAGDDGIIYFTLRAGWDPGAKYLPDSGDKLRKGNQRSRVATEIPLSPADDLEKRETATCEVVIPPEADGMAAHILRLGAGASMTAPASEPADGGGRYHVVVNGSLVRDGEEMTARSCVFATPDEAPLDITAGPAGLELLVLQFPRD
jgi:hypothetical protein